MHVNIIVMMFGKTKKQALFIMLAMGLCAEATAIEVPSTCPPKLIDEESTLALASTWFEKGQKHVASKEYADAVDAFACSLRMVEHQATLFNAAKAAILAEKYDVAIEMSTIILESSPDDEVKKEASQLLATAQNAKQKKEKEQEQEQETRPVAEPEVTVPVGSTSTTADDSVAKEDLVLDNGHSTLWKAGVISSIVGGAGLIAGGVLQVLAGSAQQTTDKADYYQSDKSGHGKVKEHDRNRINNISGS